jgi:hypothetical protein
MKKGRIKDAVLISLLIGSIAGNWIGPAQEITKWETNFRKNLPKMEYCNYIGEDKNKSMSAKEYLNVARLIAKYNLLKEGDVCRHYAAATYDTYLNLCEQNNRKDLEDKIRLAYTCKLKGLNDGHAWVEINENKKWVPIDVTNYPYKLKDELYKAGYVSIPGKNTVYPTFSDLGGLSVILQNRFPKSVDIDEWKKENVILAENQ